MKKIKISVLILLITCLFFAVACLLTSGLDKTSDVYAANNYSNAVTLGNAQTADEEGSDTHTFFASNIGFNDPSATCFKKGKLEFDTDINSTSQQFSLTQKNRVRLLTFDSTTEGVTRTANGDGWYHYSVDFNVVNVTDVFNCLRKYVGATSLQVANVKIVNSVEQEFTNNGQFTVTPDTTHAVSGGLEYIDSTGLPSGCSGANLKLISNGYGAGAWFDFSSAHIKVSKVESIKVRIYSPNYSSTDDEFRTYNGSSWVQYGFGAIDMSNWVDITLTTASINEIAKTGVNGELGSTWIGIRTKGGSHDYYIDSVTIDYNSSFDESDFTNDGQFTVTPDITHGVSGGIEYVGSTGLPSGCSGANLKLISNGYGAGAWFDFSNAHIMVSDVQSITVKIYSPNYSSTDDEFRTYNGSAWVQYGFGAIDMSNWVDITLTTASINEIAKTGVDGELGSTWIGVRTKNGSRDYYIDSITVNYFSSVDVVLYQIGPWTWNNKTTALQAGALRTILTFKNKDGSGNFNPTGKDKYNYAQNQNSVSLGITYNGTSFYELYKTDTKYAIHSSQDYLTFEIPESANVDGATIEIAKGTKYQNMVFDHIKLVDVSGQWINGLKWSMTAPTVGDYEYAFAVIGDTQRVNYYHSDSFHIIYDWLEDNAESKKIKYVIGLGDITDKDEEAEWNRAKAGFEQLYGIGLDHIQVRGNHDTLASFDAFFSKDTNYTGSIEGYYKNMANAYKLVSMGDVNYLMLALDYGADDDVLDWANSVVESYPNYNVIVITHGYLDRDGTVIDKQGNLPPSATGGVNNGDDIWNKFVSKHENITMVLSGHVYCDNIVTSTQIGEKGNNVTQFLIDPQQMDMEEVLPTGMIALFYFSKDGKTLQMQYYSPILDLYEITSPVMTLTLDVVSNIPKTELNGIGETAQTNNSNYLELYFNDENDWTNDLGDLADNILLDDVVLSTISGASVVKGEGKTVKISWTGNYSTLTVLRGASFAGNILPRIELYCIDGEWTTEKPDITKEFTHYGQFKFSNATANGNVELLSNEDMALEGISGYNGCVLKLSKYAATTVTIDYSDSKIPLNLIDNIKVRAYAVGTASGKKPEFRMQAINYAQRGLHEWIYLTNDSTFAGDGGYSMVSILGTWHEFIINASSLKDGLSDLESETNPGYLGAFNIIYRCVSNNEILYIDSIDLTLKANDGIGPVITYTKGNTISVPNESIVDFGATAFDALDNMPIKIETIWSPTQAFDSNGKILNKGTFEVKLVAKDYQKNETVKVITVIVVDKDETAPIINVPFDTISLKVGTKFTFDATRYVSDTYLKSVSCSYSEGTLDERKCLLSGVHTLTITALDTSGNKSEKVITINVTGGEITSGTIVVEENFVMVNGASVRMSSGKIDGTETTVKNGIRFQVSMDENIKNKIDGTNVKLYMFIAPVDTVDLATAPYSTIEEYKESWQLIDISKIDKLGDNYIVSCYMYNLDSSLINKELNAIAILEMVSGTPKYYYATAGDTKRSMYQVVNSAVLDTSLDNTEWLLGNSELDYYTWYGTNSLPIKITTIDEYNKLVNDINSGKILTSTITVLNKNHLAPTVVKTKDEVTIIEK